MSGGLLGPFDNLIVTGMETTKKIYTFPFFFLNDLDGSWGPL